MTFVKFNHSKDPDFITTLRKRVNHYFEENHLSIYANWAMVFKTVFMLLLYLIPYGFIVLSDISNPWIIAFLWALMGLGSAGIGLSIMHDANHNSYSRNSKWNQWLGFLLNFIGGSATNWRIQHNYLHHAYTNIEGVDEDIDPGKVMRLSPHKEKLPIHRWQHIYGWFLYGLMTLSWVTSKDYSQLKRYRDMGLLSRQNKSYPYLVTELFLSKAFFFGYLLIIPLVFSSAAWWQTLLFFAMLHFIQGFILTIVFQPAHVMPDSDYPLPDHSGNMENNWAIHQMHTTTNFAPKSRLFSWYVGGLNFQIEHHLFPNICHVHYKKISEIVKKTASEFSIPYHVQPTFVKALVEHGRMLKRLGRE